MCKDRNYGLAIYDKIFVLQNQKFILESMLKENKKKSQYSRNLDEDDQLMAAIVEVEKDIINEERKYSILFQKNYKYYL